MSYYYQTHIRNLEQEANIERNKIAAQLHQKNLLKSTIEQSQSQPRSTLRKSRKEQDLQTAAFLERSRLSAELSAIRVKAENSMNRSRLEVAFQLRKQNQIAFEQTQKMNQRHAVLKQHSYREQEAANLSYMASRRYAEEKIRQEECMREMSQRQNRILEKELDSAYRLKNMIRERYYYPY